MFKSEESSKEYFLLQTKTAREERANEKDREIAALCIQKYIRKWLRRKHFTTTTLEKFDEYFSCYSTDDKIIDVKPVIQIYGNLTNFLIVYKKKRDRERMEKLCKYLVLSLNSESPIVSYVGVALIKYHYNLWIYQLKNILYYCLFELEDLHPEQPPDYKSILLRLHTLISFTSTGTWAIMRIPEMKKLKIGMNQLCANVMGYLVNNDFYLIMKNLLTKGLCRKNNVLQPVALTAIVTLTLRPLLFSKMSDKLLSSYLVNIISVPTLIYHLNNDQSPCISLFRRNNLFSKSVKFLSSEFNMKTIFNILKGNYTLSLLANLIELANIENDELENDIYYPHFTFVITHLLESCQQYVVEKKSNTTYWHPVLGWFEQPEEYFLYEVIPTVKKQLSYLWTGNVITQLICKPLEEFVQAENLITTNSQKEKINVFYKAFLEIRSKKNYNSKHCYKLGSPSTTKIALICSLYQTTLTTLREIKSIILTGLCYKDKNILYNLWIFLRNLGPHCGLKAFLDHFATNPTCISPEFQMLILFCDCMTHYITILDDIEMYEQQDLFKLSDFIYMSYFLNQFLYKSIVNNLFDIKTVSDNILFTSLHTLLITIYRRDCQKKFCVSDHWLTKDVRVACFLSDLEKGKQIAAFLLLKMPHILPHSERVLLFRKYISDEKAVSGLTESACIGPPSTLIAVHRSRIVEDGYRQLSILPPQALKGIIRVRFINEHGLDEAGIDQDGVFKEFLEETIKRVFDPSLNLFKVTSENRLYPSSTSYVQENHLLLFEFIGRMLGKAVYEGIVVDVPFASFFVSQFCGQAGGVLYSWLDELASLDQDLYRSLTMVKHYKGDVTELELTFSLDDSVMGKIVSFELKPGGKAISVTNENKINYIHLMARFRMYVQIKDQIASFTKGFRSIINLEWLNLFSTPEWQRLISGDNVPLDLYDLRSHTQYYGGFHDKHRVICWLWDILEKDFSEYEKSLFLKFVTSCSKSPLISFAHLEPPFSIRCVEVGDDEDTGDTIGSVIRGFFTIHKKDPQNRLPTSSTCFNLLKLPNYKKKSILREKLHYAITSNTGFELS